MYRTGDLAYYNERGELCFATPVSYTHLDVYKRQVDLPEGSRIYAGRTE